MVSSTSSSAAWAILRPARGVAAPPGARRPAPCGRRAAASSTADSAPDAGWGSASQRPGRRSSSTRPRPSPASASRSADAPGRSSLPSLRAAAATAPALSSPVATPVTRSTSSCASSTTTTSCSGSTARPSMASMASSAWLVTTMSARPASRAGALGEALLADGALGRAEALARGDRHLPPRAVGHAGDELVAVAGLGVVGPLVDPLDRAAHRGDLERVEELVLGVLVAAVQLVEAQVVAAALEDGERGRAPEQRLRGPWRGGGGRGRRAGAAARWWPWRRRPWSSSRRRGGSRAPGRPATCRCRCPPARPRARRWRSPSARPAPSCPDPPGGCPRRR